MIVAAVPIKRLAGAKSRLAPHMSDETRVALIVSLVRRVVRALELSDRVDRIALVTPELDLAQEFTADVLPDRGDLNSSLVGAVEWASRIGARGLLIVPADLPCVQPSDIQQFLDAAGDANGVTVAPTRDGGTGALLLTPVVVMDPAFGQESATRHLRFAQERGLPTREVHLNGLSYDLDTMDDYRRFVTVGCARVE